MRRVVAGLAITLDDVVEAPASNWLRFNEEMSGAISRAIAGSDAILLGTQTYLDFRDRWPGLSSAVPMADFMNQTPKYIVSRTLKSVDWDNSTLLSNDLVSDVCGLKEQAGGDIQIPGSPRLVTRLMRHGLLDELALMIHPIVLGKGMRLFEGFDARADLKLVATHTFRTGVLYATYRPVSVS